MSKAFVLLDLDDTILDFHKAEAVALSKTLRGLGLEPTEEILRRYSIINRQQWELLEEKKQTREETLTRRFDILFSEYGIVCDGKTARDRYEENLAVGHYFMPGAEHLLEKLYGRYELYIISNGTARVQAGRIASAGIARYFSRIFISEEIGVNKPDREFFTRSLAQIPDFDRERALIVGDSLTSDIRGARNAGIRGCWFNFRRESPRAEIPADFEIHSLEELPPLLERLFSPCGDNC